MSLYDSETKNHLAQSDEKVNEKVSNEGPDAQKNENNALSGSEDEDVEELEDIDDEVDENTPNPT
jgi:hypothetical protein